MGIFEGLASILGGGLTGLIGSVVTKIAEYKTKKLDIDASREKYAHEVAMRKVDAELMAQEWASRTKVAEVEADGKEAVADAQAFAASFNEPQRYSESVKPSAGQGWMLVVLDFIRGIVRPGLTVYLCGVTTLVYIQAEKLVVSTPINSDQAIGMIQQIVATILYLTTTCICWWFGTRQKQPAPQRKG